MFPIIRSVAKSLLFTENTLRYRVEFPLLRDCLSQIGPAEVIFDGGAGSGEMIRLLLREKMFSKAIALEVDNLLLPKLRANLGRDRRVRILEDSLTKVPLPDACVDVAMSTQVIEHIEDDRQAAAEMGRIVKPGGHILISVPHPPERMPNPGHVRPGYTEKDLRQLFPPPEFAHLRTEYFLTLATQKRVIAAVELPWRGVFMPVRWVDRETRLSAEQRQAEDPYGIMCLFRKSGAVPQS